MARDAVLRLIIPANVGGPLDDIHGPYPLGDGQIEVTGGGTRYRQAQRDRRKDLNDVEGIDLWRLSVPVFLDNATGVPNPTVRARSLMPQIKDLYELWRPPEQSAEPPRLQVDLGGSVVCDMHNMPGLLWRIDSIEQGERWANRDMRPIQQALTIKLVEDPGAGVLASDRLGRRQGASDARGGIQGARGTHAVAEGETLAQIARQHGVSVKRLAALNKIRDPARIRVGQRLRLPARKG